MTAPSPLPLRINEDGRVIYSDATQDAVAVCGPVKYQSALVFPSDPAVQRENAARIVLAVNASEAMVAELREVEDYFEERADVDDGIPNEEMRRLTGIRAALEMVRA